MGITPQDRPVDANFYEDMESKPIVAEPRLRVVAKLT